MGTRQRMRMRVYLRELALGIAFLMVGLLLLVDGYSMLMLWLATLRCTWGLACVVQTIYIPAVPWLPLASYLALSLLGALGGWWTYHQWRRPAKGKARGASRWLAGTCLLFAVSSWSAALWVLTLLDGHVPVVLGAASDPSVLAFYALLVAMPLVAVSVGSGFAIHGVLRRPAPEG